ncbi:uncharacterized protein A4U43_C02F9520 [Asparagus officinalis]|uniref:Uncharacterized protein n=1 Tax=Asparagus officinalis TaxID=4686 RepID=A0A5P1FLY8_ASPOF|nr:uncharacterized protein A4U43_C02F9520 [Asparagus officinalis]
MAPSSSDSDSPKSTKSNSSSSSSEEEEDRKRKSNAHQSSDESTSSDGVLVEIPSNPDHDAREMQGETDGGILVNIDGSMHEGREDLFVDAPEELGSARSSTGLDESVAVIEYGESSAESLSSRPRSVEDEIARMRDRLDETQAQCRKYKEEREVFGREVSSLLHQLQDIFEQRSLSGASNKESVEHLHQIGRGGEEEAFMSPTPLHAMVNDCSKMLSHLKSILGEQLNSEDTIKGLNTALYAKEQEVEDLNLKLAESNVCQDVITSYLGSVQEMWSNSLKESSNEVSNRLLTSLEAVTGQERSSFEDFVGDGISLVEKKTLSLIEKHTQLLSETDHLRQFMAETRPELLTTEKNEFVDVFSAISEELLGRKKREASLLEKISELVDENRRLAEEVNRMRESLEAAHAETNKSKTDLEQAESKLAAAREKLSIAVTKGKSLVQHRDALKQSLAEKTNDLEKCVLELQQKSSALEASATSIDELKQLLAEKTNELENCLLILQQKSTALETAETVSFELNQSLSEKTSELEKCLLELQQKSEALDNTEAIAEELKQSLAEKIRELDKCSLELRQKSDVLENTETNCEKLKHFLTDKNNELEKCLFELQQKSDALEASKISGEELRDALSQKTSELENCLQQVQTSEAIVGELQISLAEKISELEKCQIDLQQKSDNLQTSIVSTEELINAQNLANSLQASLSEKEKVLQEIEEIMQHSDIQDDLLNMEVVDRVKWFVNHKHKSDALFMAKEDIVKLQEEISGTSVSVASHESELSEAQKELDHLAASLSEVKREKDSVQGAHDDLKYKYEKIAEKLSSIFSEKDVVMMEVAGPCASTSIDALSFDPELLVENCFSTVRERMKKIVSERERFEEMQISLYIKSQEQMLYSNILEEETVARSEVMTLSNELGRASEEVNTLRNEKEALQKELDRVEERSSLIREKLSLAVKKGKGLVQEREGFKHSLDEKNSEIEKLNQELQHQESSIIEYKEQIKSLSSYPEQIQKLESDIVSLKDLMEQNEKLLLESNSMLQTLMDSIEDIALPTDRTFEKPVDKLYWIAEHIHESEAAKAHREQEHEVLKSEAALQANRLADALATIDTLKDELTTAEKHIDNIVQEKQDLQLVKLNIEQELEKLKEVSSMQGSKLEDAYATIRSLEEQLGKMNTEQELKELKEQSFMQARKIEDAYATIRSLEDALAQASNSISNLEAQKYETESKSQQQIGALNTKLTDCMKELAATRSNLENQSEELVSHLGGLKMLIEDKRLFSLMSEEFRKKIEGLRHIQILLQDLHGQFSAKGLHIHTGFELPDFAKISALLNFEDFINDEIYNSKISTEDLDDDAALSNIVERLQYQAEVLGNRFQGLSRYTDDYITVVLQALQAISSEFIHMLDLGESLKVTVNKLEAENQEQAAEMSSLEKEMVNLLSACQDASQGLRSEFTYLLELYPEDDILKSSLDSGSIEAVGRRQEEGKGGEHASAAESLLLASRKIRIQAQQLTRVNRALLASMNDLKNKLKQAELTAETAIQDRQLSQERHLKLERDLEDLQKVCSEMKVKIQDKQVKEDILRDKEAELSSLQNALTAKVKEIDESLFSEGQLVAVIDKVNNMVIPFSESHIEEVHFSSPVDKLIYVLDKFPELLHRVASLTYEKEDMQLILDSHVREIEHQNKAAETVGMNYQDLESKKLELIELTVGLEKIIRRFGGNNLSEDQKPSSTNGFLPVLERLMISSYNEVEVSKSRMQELGAKLQAKEKVVDELLTKNKLLEDSVHARLAQPDTSPASIGSEISEIEDVGPLAKNSISPPVAHARTLRKGSTDHLVLNIGSESDPLISAQESDDKGHVFKSLNASGLIPKQGKMIADKVDGIWVSGGRSLMNRPTARLGLIAYWIFLHLWLLGTIL